MREDRLNDLPVGLPRVPEDADRGKPFCLFLFDSCRTGAVAFIPSFLTPLAKLD